MKNLIKLKVVMILAFLLIVYPGKLATINGISLFLGLLISVLEMFEPQGNYSEMVHIPIYVCSLVLSIVFLFKNNKYFNLICILIQYASLIYMFKVKFLKYWYYTLPTAIYIILSLTLLYFIFVKKQPEKVIDS